MAITMPAAPLNAETLLPYELIEQFVKPSDEQALLVEAMRLAALQWVETHSGTSLSGYSNLRVEAPGLQVAALLMVRHLLDGGSKDDAPATAMMLIDQRFRTPVIA